MGKALDDHPPRAPPAVLGEIPTQVQFVEGPELAKDAKECLEAFEARNWNATSLQLVATQLWNSTGADAGFSRLGPAGARYGLIYSYGFDGWDRLRENSQLLLSLARGENIRVVDENSQVVRRDESRVGLRLRITPNGSPDRHRFNVSGEAAWSRNDYSGRPEQEQWTYTVGAEWRLQENMWLAVTAEDRSGDDVVGDETRAGVQLRWALNEKANLERQ